MAFGPRRYSYVEHVTKSLLLSRWSGRSEVAMFTAYFDAAGTSRARVMSLAGFVSDVKKWKRFEISWQAILDREGIKCFHMTDFVSSKGEFVGWKGATHSYRRKKFIADLVECAKRNTNKAFGGSLVMDDYVAVNKKYLLCEHSGHPYSLIAHYCIGLARNWQKRRSVKDLVFMLEYGDQHQGDLMRLCRPDGIVPLFPTKQDAIPLQSADLLAWRTNYGFESAISPSKLTPEIAEKVKESFGEVWARIPHAAFLADKAWLERLCVDRRIPRR